MADTEHIAIRVSSRVLRHISRGIYRTPAGALKELVSNAHDAGARRVTVRTGAPVFHEMVITDDGKGMSADEFRRIVQHIGLSDKRAGDPFTVPGIADRRTTIGHYGIGILAVGQLASEMRIVSKRAEEIEGFVAELDFDQFETAADQSGRRSTVTAEEDLERADGPAGSDQSDGFSIGSCRLTAVRYGLEEIGSHFTRIELRAVRREVANKLVGTFRDINPGAGLLQRYSASYEDLLGLIERQEPETRQGFYPYEQLVWELGMYCPLRYPALGPFCVGRELAGIAALAAGAEFDLVVDGLHLCKPLSQAFFEDPDAPIEATFHWEDEPYTDVPEGPRVSAYLLYKRRIRPKSLQGILIREAGVSVGGYDTTFLQYPFHEGQKFGQLTGEVFATGLSGALNIDRNSFNETDDRYLSLCRWLHQKLQHEVFSDIKRRQSAPGATLRRANSEAIGAVLRQITTENGVRPDVVFEPRGRGRALLEWTGSRLTVNTDHPDGSGSSARQGKLLLAAALAITGKVSVDELDAVDRALRQAAKGAPTDQDTSGRRP